jgi:A/G-specific adenine glycosylase
MEIGALVCKPKNPDCKKCPVADNCIAYAKGETLLYPVKKNKTTIKEVHMHYAVVETPQGIVFEKRNHSSIWKGLYQPLLCELNSPQIESINSWVALKLKINTHLLTYTHSSLPITHLLSHRKLIIYFHHFQSSENIPIPDNIEVHNHEELKDLPFPIIVANYFFS